MARQKQFIYMQMNSDGKTILKKWCGENTRDHDSSKNTYDNFIHLREPDIFGFLFSDIVKIFTDCDLEEITTNGKFYSDFSEALEELKK